MEAQVTQMTWAQIETLQVLFLTQSVPGGTSITGSLIFQEKPKVHISNMKSPTFKMLVYV